MNQIIDVLWIVYLNILTDRPTVEELYGDNRPLDDKQRRVIDANRHLLVTLIDPECGIIDRLYENRWFNFQHKNYIESGSNMSDKVDRLLDIVRRRSFEDFNKFVVTLDRCGQPCAAQLLRKGGGTSIKYNKQPSFWLCKLLTLLWHRAHWWCVWSFVCWASFFIFLILSFNILFFHFIDRNLRIV